MAMVVDRHTLKDLEIFTAQDGGPGLFDRLDRTNTRGGAAALRRRFHEPRASVQEIVRVQRSIRFILERRELFQRIPVQFVIAGFELYWFGPFGAPVRGGRIVGFFEMLNLRIDSSSHYQHVLSGVANAMQILTSMREILAATRAELPDAEIGDLLREVDTILHEEAIRAVPEGTDVAEWRFWRMLDADRVFRREGRESIGRLVHLIFEIDALVSMARATEEYGFVLPDVVEGEPFVAVEGLYHPFLTRAVPNPLRIDPRRRMLFVTGPNMAGKTTYLRAAGTAIHLAHTGMGVPARSMHFSPCDALYTAISISDDIHGGISYFQAEALRARAVAEAVASGRRVAAIMDEPFKGTNVKDALDASVAYFARLARRPRCMFIVASHLIEASIALEEIGHVDCRCFRASEQGSALDFDYRLHPGVSDQRLGMRVLQEHGIFGLLDGHSTLEPATA